MSKTDRIKTPRNIEESIVSKFQEILSTLKGQFAKDAKTIKVKIIKLTTIKTLPRLEKLFPIDLQVLESIKQSITEQGYDPNNPIILWSDKNILIDGHTRKRACTELGISEIPAIFVPFKSEKEVISYALHIQGARRNLKDNDIYSAILIIDNRKSYKRYKSCSSEQNNRSKVREKVALTLNVSVTKVQRCFTIIDKASDEIKEKVLSGSMTINSAYNLIQKYDNNKKRKPSNIRVIQKDDDIVIVDKARKHSIKILSFKIDSKLDERYIEFYSNLKEKILQVAEKECERLSSRI